MSNKEQYASWTRSSLNPCFPYTSMPAYAVIPLVPVIFHMRLWTIGIAVIGMLTIWQMSRKGYTLTWLMLRIRGKIAGNRYSARPAVYIRRFSRRDWRGHY